MDYQVLARKWRPKRFADLIGQPHVVRALSNALTQARLHHAYLFTGTRGVGKTTLARILAKSLNCEAGVRADPCGECAACCQIDQGRFIDLLEIDAASNTGIDNIREVLENAQYMPTSGRYKVYIIDEVHMLSKSAFNAMLKTLEEPPNHVKFILATTDPKKIPVTVLSRCLQFNLHNMTSQQVAEYLAWVLAQEAIPFDVAALQLLGRAAAGSMRDAMSLLDQAIAYGVGEVREEGTRTMLGTVDRRYLYTILDALADADGPRLMAEVHALSNRQISFDDTLAQMAILLHQLALAQAVPETIAHNETERDVLLSLASRITPDDVQLYYQIAVHGRKDLTFAPDEYAGFSMTLLRMLAFHPVKAENVNSIAAGPSSVSVVSAHRPLSAPIVANSPIPNPSPAVDCTAASFDGDWPALVSRLGARMGAARMLAHNAVLKAWTPTRFELAVPNNFRNMAGRDYQEKLKGALADYFGRQVDLVVTVEELGLDTPAMQEARCRQEQMVAAQASLTADPVVQQFVHEFNAVLLMETVKPI